jgi:hypothetical protein
MVCASAGRSPRPAGPSRSRPPSAPASAPRPAHPPGRRPDRRPVHADPRGGQRCGLVVKCDEDHRGRRPATSTAIPARAAAGGWSRSSMPET